MDPAVDIAQVIAMFAALVAVWYARQAAVETRALRHEERVARLLELIADVGEHGTAAPRRPPMVARPQLVVAQHRLRASLTATGKPLPACEQLLAVEWPKRGSRRVEIAGLDPDARQSQFASWHGMPPLVRPLTIGAAVA